ncbi:unnamed protein product [Vitrella brassicaformis CCMP3155]|uniref:Ion transport domain-containing protein n=5 Tax=Vitrella brassicaformis TaxID=1169539 RepID=A0A0G4G828_VITBC|nr:unnamed protein product [Vitrella brassicaformis CCMP3155]|eukprot:CEM24784.1 unnamed protein product [Vitrella brassicaformis CCMP3155]
MVSLRTLKARDSALSFFSHVWKRRHSKSGLRDGQPFNYIIHGKQLRFPEYSLFVFSDKNKFRYWCVWLTEFVWFERAILLCIVLNSISLAFYGHDQKQEVKAFLDDLDIFFTVVFNLEMAVKIVSRGFVLGPGAYLKDAWNWLDFFVVLSADLGYALQSVPALKKINVLRTFRAFRPLRSLNALPGMRIIVATLFQSLPKLGNLFLLACFVLGLFAILGINLFERTYWNRCRFTVRPVDGLWEIDPHQLDFFCGAAYRCKNPDKRTTFCRNLLDADFDTLYNTNYSSYYSELSDSLVGESADYGVTGFQHMGTAFLTVFQCITLEGWVEQMYKFQDSYSKWFASVYFSLLILLGAVFVVNLTLAVLWERFEDNARKRQMEQPTSEEAKVNDKLFASVGHAWMKSLAQVIKAIDEKNLQMRFKSFSSKGDASRSPSVRGGNSGDGYSAGSFLSEATEEPLSTRIVVAVRTFCYTISTSPLFIFLMVICILANTIILALDRYDDDNPISPAQQTTFENMNLAFTVIFSVEILLKLIGFGRGFFRDSFNIFDSVVVIFSIVELTQPGGAGASAFRTFRLLRILKLARNWTSLRILLEVLGKAVGAMSNFCFLLFLFLYIYTLIGMTLFAGKLPSGKGEDRRENFDNFFNSFITVFIVLSGENWNEVMIKTIRHVGYYSLIYFVLLLIVGNLILLNLFLAILLGSFTDARTQTFKTYLLNFIELCQKMGVTAEDLESDRGEGESYAESSFSPRSAIGGSPSERGVGGLMGKLRLMSSFMREGQRRARAKTIAGPPTLHRSYSDLDVRKEEDSFKLPPEDLQSPEPITDNHEGPPPPSETPVSMPSPMLPLPGRKRTGLTDGAPSPEQPRDHLRRAATVIKSPSSKVSRRNLHKRAADEKSWLIAQLREMKRQGKLPTQLLRRTMGADTLTLADTGDEAALSRSARSLPVGEPHPQIASSHRVSDDQPSTETLDSPEAAGVQGEVDEGERERDTERERRRSSLEKRQVNFAPPTDDIAAAARRSSLPFVVIEADDSSRHVDKDKETPAALPPSDALPTDRSMVVRSSSRKVLRRHTIGPDASSHSLGMLESGLGAPVGGGINPLITQDKKSGALLTWQSHLAEAWTAVRRTVSNVATDVGKALAGRDIPTDPRPYLLMKQRSIEAGAMEQAEQEEDLLLYGGKKGHHQAMVLPSTIFEDSPMERAAARASVALSIVPEAPTKPPIPIRKKRVRTTLSPVGLGAVERYWRTFRQVCRAIVTNAKFDAIIMSLILASSILMAVAHPEIDPNSDFGQAVWHIDVVLTFTFVAEMLLKWFAFGLLFESSNSYFRVGWNWLDFVVVTTSLLTFIFGQMESSGQDSGFDTSSLLAFRALRVLKSFRAFRPLRIISRSSGIKLVVDSLLSSIPSLANVFMICFLMYLIFAILGVNLFKGAFYACYDDAGNEVEVDRAACKSDDSLNLVVADSNFDNVYRAMVTLFQVSTTEGWIDTMYDGVDAASPGKYPKSDRNMHRSPWAALYFVAFIVVGNFFSINLFVGVIIDQFQQMKEEMEGGPFMTENQRKWKEVQRMLFQQRILEKKTLQFPKSNLAWLQAFRTHFAPIVASRGFEFSIMFIITLNTAVMCMRHATMSNSFAQTLETLNIVFAVIFNLEAAVKLLIFSRLYWKDPWNTFDFMIVVGTDVTLIVIALQSENIRSNLSTMATMLRAFRIGRVLRLIRQAAGLRVLFQTMLNVIPSLGNIASLVFLLFFIYAVLGMSLFGLVEWGEHLNRYANFRRFGDSLLVLLRIATGEDWHELMYDCANNSGGTWLAYIYFLSFMLLVSFVMMNLFIAAVLEGFSETVAEDNLERIRNQHEQFMSMWMEHSKGERWIDIYDFLVILDKIQFPVGFRGEFQGTKAVRFKRMMSILAANQLPIYGTRVHLHDVIINVVRRACTYLSKSNPWNPQAEESVELSGELVDAWKKQFPELDDYDTAFDVGHLLAARFIQKLWEKRKKRKTLISIVNMSRNANNSSGGGGGGGGGPDHQHPKRDPPGPPPPPAIPLDTQPAHESSQPAQQETPTESPQQRTVAHLFRCGDEDDLVADVPPLLPGLVPTAVFKETSPRSPSRSPRRSLAPPVESEQSVTPSSGEAPADPLSLPPQPDESEAAVEMDTEDKRGRGCGHSTGSSGNNHFGGDTSPPAEACEHMTRRAVEVQDSTGGPAPQSPDQHDQHDQHESSSTSPRLVHHERRRGDTPSPRQHQHVSAGAVDDSLDVESFTSSSSRDVHRRMEQPSQASFRPSEPSIAEAGPEESHEPHPQPHLHAHETPPDDVVQVDHGGGEESEDGGGGAGGGGDDAYADTLLDDTMERVMGIRPAG